MTQNPDSMDFTGERFVPEVHGDIELEHIHRYLVACQLTPGKVVLDIASGEGYGSAMLAEEAEFVYGVDISSEAVEHARSRYPANNLRFLRGSCADIPLPDASVDVIVSFETIEHHDQHEEMMREFKRLLRPGGVLVLSSPDKYHYSVEPNYVNPYHVKELYFHELKALLDRYFRNAAYFGQKVAFGSAIFAQSIATPIVGFRNDGNRYSKSPGLEKPIYWLVVASDGDLPELPSGLLEVPLSESQSFQALQQDMGQRCENLQSEITRRNEQYCQLNQSYETLQSEINLRDEACEQLNQTVAESQSHIENLSQTVAERDREIRNLGQEILSQREKIRELQKSGISRKGFIASLHNVIEDREYQINVLNHEVAVRDLHINGLNEEIAARDSHLADRDNGIAELQRRATESDDALASANYKLRRLGIPHRLAIRAVQMFMHPIASYRISKDMKTVNDSLLFDVDYYLANYRDIRVSTCNPLRHFCELGWKEGRNPSPWFDTRDYLARHPGLAEAGINPFVHYIQHGRRDEPKDASAAGDAEAAEPKPQAQAADGLASPTPTEAGLLGFDKEAARHVARDRLLDFLAKGEHLAFKMPSAELSEPLTTVIIVLYNQAGLSLACLNALSHSQGVNLEVIIVDNASTDETHLLLDRLKGVQVIRNRENLHFLKAVNQAAEAAKGKYLLLLNNDAMVEPHALARAVKRLESAPDIGAVGGKIKLYDGSLQEAGSIIWEDGSCLGYGRGMSPDDAPFQFVRSVDYCSGVFLLTPRTLFEQLGRLDLAFAPAYYEETDYCVRLIEAGYHIVYDPTVEVRHFEFASSTTNAAAFALQQQNQAKFAQKHAAFLAAQRPPDVGNVLLSRTRLPSGAKRILVIDDRVPHACLGSGYPRARLMLRLLAEQGNAVTLYPLQFPLEDWGEVYQSLPDTVEVMLHRGPNGLADFLKSRRGHYDMLLISRPHNMQHVKRLLDEEPGLLEDDSGNRPAIIYDAEALFTLREQIKAELKQAPIPEEQAQAQLLEEVSLAKLADVVLTVSAAEAKHFRSAECHNVFILGHSLESLPTANPFSARSRFLFVGAMHEEDSPNVDSIRWFVGQIWPIIQQRLNGTAKLDIVGYCRAYSVLCMESEDIEVYGSVDSLDGFYERARVFIVPTRFAAGIPFKAHEAAAAGVPMVVTPLIAEQLGWGNEIPNAAEPEEFAEHCIRLFNDESVWQQQRESVLRLVGRDCSPDHFKVMLSAALQCGCGSAMPEVVPEYPQDLASTEQAEEAKSGIAVTSDHWGAEAGTWAVGRGKNWFEVPAVQSRISRMVSGREDVDIYHWLIERMAERGQTLPVEAALTLGCGAGDLERGLYGVGFAKHYEAMDVAEQAIERAKNAVADLPDAEFDYRVVDINQVSLQAENYDVIFCPMSAHHFADLEHVFAEVHKALKPGGIFFLNEYIGPKHFQWTERQISLVDSLLKNLPEKWVRTDDSTLRRAFFPPTEAEVIAIDPSEAIRSDEILPVLAREFAVTAVRGYGGALLHSLLDHIGVNFVDDQPDANAMLNTFFALEDWALGQKIVHHDFAVIMAERPEDVGGRLGILDAEWQ